MEKIYSQSVTLRWLDFQQSERVENSQTCKHGDPIKWTLGHGITNVQHLFIFYVLKPP